MRTFSNSATRTPKTFMLLIVTTLLCLSNVVVVVDAALADTHQKALDDAYALWKSWNLDTYSYGYKRSCFCTLESRDLMSLNVENNVVVSGTYRDELDGPIGDDILGFLMTMDDIFGRLQSAIDQDAASMAVVYNAEYGYPETVDIDYDTMMADEEFSIKIDYLAPVGVWKSAATTSQDLWESQSIVEYTYVYQRSCECLDEATEPKTIHVMNDVIVSVNGEAISTTTTAMSKNDVNANLPTLSGLFQQIDDAFEQNAFSVNVQYDDVYGYPTSIFIDYDQRMADEELSVTATLQTDTIVLAGDVDSAGDGTSGGVGDGVGDGNVTDTTNAPTAAPTSPATEEDDSGSSKQFSAYYGMALGSILLSLVL